MTSWLLSKTSIPVGQLGPQTIRWSDYRAVRILGWSWPYTKVDIFHNFWIIRNRTFMFQTCISGEKDLTTGCNMFICLVIWVLCSKLPSIAGRESNLKFYTFHENVYLAGNQIKEATLIFCLLECMSQFRHRSCIEFRQKNFCVRISWEH